MKIFENDIIDIYQTVNGHSQFVIKYDDYKFSSRYYNQETKKLEGWYDYSLDEKEIEVIGNIFDEEVIK